MSLTKSNNRNQLLTYCMILVILLSNSVIIDADAGPKPSITIYGENIPGEICYIDLLVEAESESNYESFNELDEADYDQAMFQVLKNYSDGKWKPALAAGAGDLIFGDIDCVLVDGKTDNHFSYIGVPDRFKVIVVTEDLEIVVSNLIERETFQSIVSFDYETGIAKEKKTAGFTFQLIQALILTLLLELLVLIIFRFSIRKSLKPFLIINILTQLLLHLSMTWAMMTGGMILALLMLFFIEFIIVIIEAIAFSKFLHEHTVGRRVGFALAANFVSFVASFFIWMIAMFVGNH